MQSYGQERLLRILMLQRQLNGFRRVQKCGIAEFLSGTERVICAGARLDVQVFLNDHARQLNLPSIHQLAQTLATIRHQRRNFNVKVVVFGLKTAHTKTVTTHELEKQGSMVTSSSTNRVVAVPIHQFCSIAEKPLLLRVAHLGYITHVSTVDIKTNIAPQLSPTAVSCRTCFSDAIGLSLLSDPSSAMLLFLIGANSSSL